MKQLITKLAGAAMFAAALAAPATMDARVVYFQKPSSWTGEAGIHAWHTSYGDRSGTFGEFKMSPVPGTSNIYVFASDDDFNRCIFFDMNNNEGNRKEIWDPTHGNLYQSNGDNASYTPGISALYVVGSNVKGMSNWTPKEALAFTSKGNNTYTIDIEITDDNSEICFLTQKPVANNYGNRDWAIANSNNRYGSSDGNTYLDNKFEGTATEYVRYANSNSAADCKNWKINKGTYTITFNTSTKKITVTDQGGSGSDFVVPANLYLVGQIDGAAWGNPCKTISATSHEGNKWVFNATVQSSFNDGGAFCFVSEDGCDADLGKFRYASADGKDKQVELGTAYKISYKSGNSWFLPAGTYVFTVDMTNTANPTVTVTREQVDLPEVPNTLYMISNEYAADDITFNTTQARELLKDPNDPNIFSCVLPNYWKDNNGFQFKFIEFRTNKHGESFDNTGREYGRAGGEGEIYKNQASGFECKEDGKNGSIWKYYGNTEAIRVTVNFNDKTVKITGVNANEIPYYFIGDANDWFSNKNEKGGVVGNLTPNALAQLESTWKFQPTTEKPEVSNASGWYKLIMPTEGNKLWGQFKIFTGHWGEHDLDWGYNKDTEDKYYFDGCRLEAGKNTYGLEKGKSNRGSSNVPLKHNAFSSAVLWFNPTTNEIYLQGDAEDYFVYYMRAADANSSTVKVKFSNNSPNGLNYRRDFNDWNNGVELVKIVKGDEFQTVTENVNSHEVKHIFEGKLQNGAKVNYNVWKRQIPLGAEKPAGCPFVLSVSDCQDQAAKNLNMTCRLGNIYIIEDFYVHFRPDAEALGTDVEVAYRVYGLDENYDLVIYNPDLTTTKVSANDQNTGWIDMPHKINGSDLATGSQVTEWGWDDGEWMVNLVDEANKTRKAVPFQHAGQYLQLKIKVNDGAQKVMARAGALTNGTYLMPTRLTFGEHPQERALTGTDIYVKAGIETGIDDIVVEPVEGEYGEATDAAPVYYNLQGVRVAEPTNGIFIKVTGNKSEKVIF